MNNTTYVKSKWLNPLTVTAGLLLLVHMLLRYVPVTLQGKFDQSQPAGLDPVALALVVVALLPWIRDFLSGAKFPGGIEVAFRAVERRQETNEEAIKELRFIVEGFLTIAEFRHLLNIRDNVEYHVADKDVSPLMAELRRLRALKLIEQTAPTHGVSGFAVAGNVCRIGDWFRLTPRGEEYLRMREENEEIGAQSDRSK